MSKNLLLLLVASGSFSIALLMANSSQAAPIISDNSEGAIFSPAIPSLSLTSPSLNLTEQQQNPILHSLGCNCPTCTQSRTTNVSIGS